MNRLQHIVEDILDSECPTERLDATEVQCYYADGQNFQTAQHFCVFLLSTAHARFAVYGSSATANDDGRPHLLAILLNDEAILPLTPLAHVPSVAAALGFEVAS